MKLKSKLKMALSSMALLTAMSSYAFSPASGAWSIDAESGNSAPGRGFSIEVENEILVFTYFGYRADGSSVFYVAAGAMNGNTFTGALNETKGGTVMGGAYKGGSSLGSPGNVSINFTSGVKATITLPGESPKAVSKLAFGYSATQDSLLGKYVMAYTMSTATTIADTYTLTKKLSTSTSYGNGLVSNSTNTFACENIFSGAFAGAVFCAETTGTVVTPSSYDDSYIFKISGDRGTGVGSYYASSSLFPSYVLRVATQSGKTTGIVEPQTSSVYTSTAVNPTEHVSSLGQIRQKDSIKSSAIPDASNRIQLSDEESADFQKWIQEAKSLVSQGR